VIRRITGVKVYLHAVIDNFSRRILAWRLAERLDPLTTCEVLAKAGREMIGEIPTVVADSGVENVNGPVDALVGSGIIHRLLALAEVSYSNSMIEAWWRSLRHNWLYLHELDDIEAVRMLVDFYVHEHNAVMPDSAFRGQTPAEIYFRTNAHLETDLKAAAKAARQRRLIANRAARCHRCEPEDQSQPPSPARQESLRFP